MSDKLRDIIDQMVRQDYATDTGRKMHARMQRIVIDGDASRGDMDIRAKISENPTLAQMFSPASRTEVPIAGTINGRFISRRIDRLFTDDENKRVYVLDYKTDTDRVAFHDKYVEQINEYKTLLHDIYPNYEIRGYILWLHDFSVEEI